MEPEANQTPDFAPEPSSVQPSPQPQIFSSNIGEPSKPEKKSFASRLGGKKKLIVIVALILAVLVGGVAAAYYVVVLPSKPENKLLTAFTNLAGKKQLNSSWKIDFQDKKTSSSVKGFSTDFTLGADLEKTTFAVAGKVGVSGAAFPFEMRYLDKDLYIKVGGLSSLNSLLPALDPAAQSYLGIISGINDQWYVIDRSVWQQTGASSCTSDISFVLNKDDVDKINAAYKKYPLFKVKSTANESVDGIATTKMELDPASDETAHQFANDLTDLSVVKKVKACLKDTGLDNKVDEEVKVNKQEETTGNIFAYVTSDKQLKKLIINTEDANTSAKVTIVFNDKAVNVTKPDGAKPIQDLLGGLLGGLYGSSLYGNGLTR